MNIIEFKDISKSFYKNGRRFDILSGLNFSIAENSTVLITGVNGAGKSTLLNILLSLVSPDSGNVFINEKSIEGLDSGEFNHLMNSFVGYVPQARYYVSSLSVLDNVCLPAFISGEDVSSDRAMALLDEFHILHLKDMFPDSLSGGELKKMMIARALMNDAPVLVMDEPTSELDVDATCDFIDIINSLKQKQKTIIIVSHDDKLLSVADEVYLLSDGNMIKKEL